VALADPAGSVYQAGEPIRLSVRTDTDAFVLVFNIDSEGFVHLLHPQGTSAEKLAGGRWYDIPTDGDRELVVGGKTGVEFVFAVSVNDRDAVDGAGIADLLADEGRSASNRYRVKGDPFLAANRIAGQLVEGIANRRDESLAFTYFYVSEAVDYPRYLCEDCDRAGKDPYAENLGYVATSAFDREDHLSYPLKPAFERTGDNVAAAEKDSDDETTVYVSYYGYGGAYYPYSSFHVGYGYWGFGWGWGYPYYYYPAYCYPYRWGYGYPYSYYGGYCSSGYYGYPVAYRPAVRPAPFTRYRDDGLRFAPKSDTALRLKTRPIAQDSGSKVAVAGSSRTKTSSAVRPISKMTPTRPIVASTRQGVRGPAAGKTQAKAVRPVSKRSVHKLSGTPAKMTAHDKGSYRNSSRSARSYAARSKGISSRGPTVGNPTTGQKMSANGHTGRNPQARPSIKSQSPRSTKMVSGAPSAGRSGGAAAGRSTGARSAGGARSGRK
jgi:hypothetical protein